MVEDGAYDVNRMCHEAMKHLQMPSFGLLMEDNRYSQCYDICCTLPMYPFFFFYQI